MKKSAAKEIRLDIATARAIALSAQGLDRPAPFGKGKPGALETIRRLGYVQLDTLSVVARAHHHTLWTRTGQYEEPHLDELMRDKTIFEYWSHAAAYLPIEDFRFSLPRKIEHRKGRAHWFAKDKRIMAYVLDRIKAEGALQARDFETDRRRGSWFDWKPAKIALEQLFHDGTLMVTERKGFQKVYDLAERVLPANIDTSAPSTAEFAGYLIRSTLRAQGIAAQKDFTHLRRGMQQPVEKTLKKLLKEGELREITVEGIKEPQFIFADTDIDPGNFQSSIFQSSILSPFDNSLIRRERLMKLYGYDYQLECYLPGPKRKFGYFCLPVLYGDQFVGKFDPKADRATGTFYVKRFYLDHPPEEMDAFLASFANTLKEFAAFNGCKKIVVEKTFPAKLKAELKIGLKK